METILGLLITLVVLISLVGVLTWFGGRKAIKLTVSQKRGWLIAHVTSIVIYFSGLFGTLLLAISAKLTTEQELIYAAHLFVQYFDWFLIIPGAFASLITGVWLAVRTNWGMTKHYWVMAKWLGNIFAILYGGVFMRVWVHDNFNLIFSSPHHPLQNSFYLQNREMLFVGISLSFSILIFLFVISYLKPWGKRDSRERSS
ncbi:hypothetical protein N752_04165 [Desulforamulus aquiferis]|nr:DUF2269 family protein [Desulforamulus aquiferis]RYD06529.1 hypothetical protein N752_04165 [Desulforamulus aquiferis]